MKKYMFLVFAICLLAVSFYTVNAYDATKVKNSKASPTSSAAENDTAILGKAEDFTLVDLDGNEVSLSDFKGKKVFLNFWATWCPPCKAEMPEIEKVYQETKDSDLVILAVEIGESHDTVKSFLDKKDYNFKILLDLDQSVSTTYGITAIPTSFFIDEEGNIISKRVGGMSYDEMKEYIATLDK